MDSKNHQGTIRLRKDLEKTRLELDAGVFFWWYYHDQKITKISQHFLDFIGYEDKDGMVDALPVVEKDMETFKKKIAENEDDVPFIGKLHIKKDQVNDMCNELMYIGVTYRHKNERVTAGVLVDIEHKMRIEAQLKHVDKLMLVGQMFGGVAHDIKNQIMTIDAAVTMIDKVCNDEQVIKYLRSIEEALENSAFLLQHLTKFTGNNRHDLRHVNVNELVAKTVTILCQTVKGDFEFLADYQAQHDIVLGEEHLLDNVLLNIALNARDAMPNGGTIKFRTYNRETNPKSNKECIGWVFISIKDDGIGMDQRTMKRIFEPYFSTKPVGAGAGMGLALCLSTLHSHEGTIEVFSEVNKGTEFVLGFPLSAQKEEKPEPQQVLPNNRVLILENDPSVRIILRSVLKELGYKVKAHSSFEDMTHYIEECNEEIEAAFIRADMVKIENESLHKELKRDKGMTVIYMGSDHDIKIDIIKNHNNDRIKLVQMVGQLLQT